VKKLFLYSFLISICTSNVFADNSVVASRAVPSAASQTEDNNYSEPSRAVVNRNAVAFPVAVAKTTDLTTKENDDAVVSRNTTMVQQNDNARSTSVVTKPTISRSVSAGNSESTRQELEQTVRTVGRNARVESASINENPALRRMGITLRPSTAEVGGRATIGNTGVQTGSNFNPGKSRSVQNRAAASAPTKESIAEATQRLQQTAELNKSCQEQYNDCMDQFCSVIDANQKRCSCSANLSRYTKVESAVKEANSELNDVAQRIRYVGLSADEIRAIMNSTEAEKVLDQTKDTSQSRNMLDEIESLIKNPTSATSSSSSNISTGLDMDLDFSSSGSSTDLFSLDLSSGSSSSFSNLRGTDLYSAAKKRCNTVLTQCKTAGGTPQQITGNYDLAIDKDCIAYEQGLTKMNETLKSNVRSANQMLQKARLAVLQNKNQYDAKGCISALNTCMVDDMVCGSDYKKCLDPTKKYIDENGKVVLGQNISNIIAFMDGYNNAEIDSTYLTGAMATSYEPSSCISADGKCVAKYLLEKIGTGATIKDGGLCRPVLDKCQYYTYDSNSNYEKYNDIVVNYIQRAMVNIYAAQQKIISDYASSCMVDIATCYNQQVSQVNTWSSTASVSSIYNVMRGACRNVALTCSYAVFANDATSCPTSAPDTCINSISQMFYQSLLCPDNSTYQSTQHATDNNGTVVGYVNERCTCNSGYSVWSGTCTSSCVLGEYRSSLGVCTSCPIGTYGGGVTGGVEASSCTTCASGTTISTGSTDEGDCE